MYELTPLINEITVLYHDVLVWIRLENLQAQN